MEVAGAWKYVCDNGFDSNGNGVHMACTELGHAGGAMVDGSAPVDLFYDDIACSGAEMRLADCPRGEGEQCDTNEAVMLTCGAASGK